ncbi:MAG: hypothetical protein P1P84_25865, partial [Deferrisomatales bacterium]|nr:hypothetical protein [Deferrisomatales bacterium]
MAHNESWDENYGEDGVPDGSNIPFNVLAGNSVQFDYDPVSHLLTIATIADLPILTVAGSTVSAVEGDTAINS